jgi:tetratricopeptide (TPR) repeat protein
MTDDAPGRSAGALLIDQAWSAFRAGRVHEALSAARRVIEAAEHFDDLSLLVRALSVEAYLLQKTGDPTAALARYTRILGLAQDPVTSRRVDDPLAVEAVAEAHWEWVDAARFLTGIPVRDLFGVLDAAERWLVATGHPDWRASILDLRAAVHGQLGEFDTAVDLNQEALALKIRYPNAPGYALAGHRYALGDSLLDAGRAAEAVPHYRAILADPDVGMFSTQWAHAGLADCELAAGDLAAARREALLAVQLAEPFGGGSLTRTLGVLAKVHRAAGDLDAAWEAATRRVEEAARIGGHFRPYQAARDAAEIALDRGDRVAAGRLLDELDQHAPAMDAAAGSTAHTAAAARLRQRLAELYQLAEQ